MKESLDFRSDTVTQPTQKMRDAMYRCEVGDDVIGEDPTINELEAYTAGLLGKDAALFVPSGAFGNQCAILSHIDSSNEIIVSEDCHIVQHEAGASALICRAQTRTISPANTKYMTASEIEKRIRKGRDVHYPLTGLICLEQATAYGDVIPLSVLEEVRELSTCYGVPVHIDGARFFNAAIVLGKEPVELAPLYDSISVCLSKNLCAPVGSLLAGSASFIERARENRKKMGGGMRQAGFLAAAGLVALKDMRLRLAEDHKNAKILARLISQVNGVEVLREPEINMVFVSLKKLGIADDEIVSGFLRHGIKIYPPENSEYRFLTHYYITEESINKFVEVLKKIAAN